MVFMKSLKINFIVRRGRANQSGLVPVFLRVTINGVRFETGISKSVPETLWSAKTGRLAGKSREVKEVNEYLNSLSAKVYAIQRQMIHEDIPFNREEFTRLWHGIKPEPKMLLEIFKQHNEQVKALIGQQYSLATWRRYVTSHDHTLHFMQYQYNFSDIAVDQIKYGFITDYEFWLKAKRQCNHNSTIKYLTNFKKIINICLKNGWIEKIRLQDSGWPRRK